MCLLPFSTVENRFSRKQSKYGNVCVNSFKLYMHKGVKKVEEKIKEEMPDLFSILFDGWTDGSTHFLAIFATYPIQATSTNYLGYQNTLLTLSPLNEEDSLGASSHFEFIQYILSVYRKSICNLLSITADNCSINLAIAKLAQQLNPHFYFVGCSIHLFNHYVQYISTEYQQLLSKILSVMQKLNNLIPGAKLRKLTHFKPVTAHITRWSSTISMVKR